MAKRNLPCHHPCRRRGDAHALRRAQGDAQGRRPADARACARARRGRRARPDRGGGRAGCRCGRRPIVGKAAPERDGARAGASGSAPATPCSRRGRRFAAGADDVIVLFGDTPLITAETLKRAARGCWPTAPTSSCSASRRPTRPAMAGCIIEGRQLVAIREEKDATAAERAIGFCNAGVMAFPRRGCCRSSRRSATTTPRANST